MLNGNRLMYNSLVVVLQNFTIENQCGAFQIQTEIIFD